MKRELKKVLKRWELSLERYGKIDEWNINEEIALLNSYIKNMENNKSKRQLIRRVRDIVICQNSNKELLLSSIQKALGKQSSISIEKRKKKFRRHQNGQAERFKGQTKNIFFIKLQFKDGMLLRNFDIETESLKDCRKVRRIVEKRMCQSYYKKNSRTTNSNKDRYWEQRATSYQLYNIGQIENIEYLSREDSTHWKRDYDNNTGKVVFKKKMIYNNEQEALEAIEERKKLYPFDTKEMHAYECKYCHKWHIGHACNHLSMYGVQKRLVM